MTSRNYTIATIILVYILFAILLNSVGVVILQSIEFFEVGKTQAAVLEGFKDLPIALVSFVIAAQIPRIGYKRGLIISLFIVLAGLVLLPTLSTFLATKLHFLLIGVGFGVAKVVVYSSVGLLTTKKQEHASLLTLVEGFFVLGVLANYWIFSAFINDLDPTDPSWLNVYWWLSGLCVVAIIMVSTMSLPEDSIDAPVKRVVEAYVSMLRIAVRPLILVFVVSLFLYVLIEQGIGTWLPTFNREVLGLPTRMSVQATSIFALAIAVGRLSAGVLLRYVSWIMLMSFNLMAIAILIVVTLPITQDLEPVLNVTWRKAPLAVYLLPLIGFFMAPIYPIVSSVTLSALPKREHPSVTGLLVVFSALGGTLGSFITGYVFEVAGGQIAFYSVLIPLSLIFGALWLLKGMLTQTAPSEL